MREMRVLAPESTSDAGPLSGFLAVSDSVAAAMVERDGTIREGNRALERLAGSVASFHDVVVTAQRAIVTDLLARAGPGWSSVQAGLVRSRGEPVDCKIWARTHGEGVLVLAEPSLTPMAKLNDLLLELNDELLGAASIMTGELRLERSRTDLMALISDAVQEIQPAARAGQVAVSWSGTGSADAVVDERRVRQVLDNLLSNAVKYCPDGGQVSVSCQVRGPVVTVGVTDTGIGIPAAEQKQLFGRYFRASTALGCGIEGTGLGLANARAFAEAHGGTLTCTSEPGSGSTFTLVLPDGLTAT